MLVKVIADVAGRREEVVVESSDVLNCCSREEIEHELYSRFDLQPPCFADALERWNQWVAAG